MSADERRSAGRAVQRTPATSTKQGERGSQCYADGSCSVASERRPAYRARLQRWWCGVERSTLGCATCASGRLYSSLCADQPIDARTVADVAALQSAESIDCKSGRQPRGGRIDGRRRGGGDSGSGGGGGCEGSTHAESPKDEAALALRTLPLLPLLLFCALQHGRDGRRCLAELVTRVAVHPRRSQALTGSRSARSLSQTAAQPEQCSDLGRAAGSARRASRWSSAAAHRRRGHPSVRAAGDINRPNRAKAVRWLEHTASGAAQRRLEVDMGSECSSVSKRAETMGNGTRTQ